jgi:predicted RNA-binding protein
MSQDEVDFLIGGDELFHHPRFEKHYSFMKEDYSPPNDKPIAFFMSCSKHKPFYKSPYRRVFYAMLKKLQIKDISQIYTVSEPAILVPEELDGSPVSMYDFPPEHLGKKGRELFVVGIYISICSGDKS